MKCMSEWLERKAENKIDKKSQKVARAVDRARRSGETVDHVSVPIGRAPWVYAGKSEYYVARVADLTVERLGSIGITGVAHDREATIAASQKVSLRSWSPSETAAYSALVNVPQEYTISEVAGRLTVVLALEREPTPAA